LTETPSPLAGAGAAAAGREHGMSSIDSGRAAKTFLVFKCLMSGSKQLSLETA